MVRGTHESSVTKTGWTDGPCPLTRQRSLIGLAKGLRAGNGGIRAERSTRFPQPARAMCERERQG